MQARRRTGPIVLLARSWQGTGGMQRLNKDLAGQCAGAYKERFSCIHPEGKGSVRFFLQALSASIRTGFRKGHVHLSDLSLLPLGVLARMCGAHVTATACGLDVTYRPAWHQWMIRLCIKRMHTIVCISNATRDEVVKRGAVSDQVVVIPCGVHSAPVRQKTVGERPVLITVGRLVERKGVAWFIENVMPLLSGAHYIVIGSGPEEQAIREIVARKGLRHAVEIVTHADERMRDAYLAQADVFVMPNIPVAGDTEGFGIVCIEASSRGVPVAASHIEGLQDAVIDGQTGRFFSPNNAQECVSVISALLSHPFDVQAIAHTTQKHFGWDTVFALYRTHVFD